MKNLKVSSLFHWLYGAVMFLPILLLPVFMIYSHRHEINSGTLEVPQNEIVDFNQYVHELDDTYWTNQNSTVQFLDNNAVLLSGNQYGNIIPKTQYRNIPVIYNNVYYIRADIQLTTLTNEIALRFEYDNYNRGLSKSTNNVDLVQTLEFLYTPVITCNDGLVYVFDYRSSGFDDVIISNIICVNFTQMFGEGNEPSISQFNQWYNDDYYSYTLSHKELLKDYSTITYSDTDIISQATYQLYNATNKYFNISQFFGFENLWDYMVLNWFGGNVTIYLRIFWQLLTYWLVVSIAWLIFDLFMYVPKLAHRWLDRSTLE